MTNGLIECFEKEKKILTLTVEDESTGGAYDLTRHGGYTVTFYVHDTKGNAVSGTNFINAHTVNITGAAAGEVSVTLLSTELAIPASSTDLIEGIWQNRLVSVNGLYDVWTRPKPFHLRRNVMILADG